MIVNKNLTFLTVEQMQMLEKTGLDLNGICPIFYYVKDKYGEMYHLDITYTPNTLDNNIHLPAYTVQDLLCLLPHSIVAYGRRYLRIQKQTSCWVVSYYSEYGSTHLYYETSSAIDLINALYNMVCRLILNKDISTNKAQFDIKKAKKGEPVCTIDGKDVRIVCFDRQNADGKSIVALVRNENGNEQVYNYFPDGKQTNGSKKYNLVMK